MDSIQSLRDNCGQLVAFEGDPDTIAIQLQLIPPSSKILIVPGFEASLPRRRKSIPFDALSYIHDVHMTLAARLQSARAFLQLSTPTQPRLVFMNGGTVCARAACIRAICDNSTDGNPQEAERQFNQLVRDGVDGLLRNPPGSPQPKQIEVPQNGELAAPKAPRDRDRRTGSEDTVVPDVESRGLPSQEFGCISRVPVTSPSADRIVDGRPSLASDELSQPDEDGTPSWESPAAEPGLTSRAEKRSTFGAQIPFPIVSGIHARDSTELSGDEESDSLYSESQRDSSVADSKLFTEDVVFGEAYIVDLPSRYLQASNKRTKSAETIDVGTTRSPEGTFGHGTPEPRLSGSPTTLRPLTADGRLQRKPSFPLFQLPRTTYDPLAETRKKDTPRTVSIEATVTESRPTARRGTLSEDSAIDVTAGTSSKLQESTSFEPAFRILEDLIIQFKDGSSDEILESVVATYKDGSYPAALRERPPILVPSPTSPVFSGTHDPSVHGLASHIAAETDGMGHHERQESEVYHLEGDGYQPETSRLWPSQNGFGSSPAGEMRQFGALETPSMTPPPTANGMSHRFCDFSYTNSSTAVHIQDSLRAILDSYFPTGETGYSQGYSLVTTGTDRLWKPVFGNIDDSTGAQRTTVDQIIAFGREEGVDLDFFAHISGQIEALGMKRNGINKAGKLDLRYLVANVLQTAEEQSKRTGARPWSNPKGLATMLVPHLEAYLASNPMIGLLILHYPITHLSTVLALRKLIGADLFKVAGLLDGLESGESSFGEQPQPHSLFSGDIAASRAPHFYQRSRTDSIHSRSTTQSLLPSHLRNRLSVISLSKADYLLPAAASPTEIKNFLISIREGLIERSSFYIPDPEPGPILTKYPVPPPIPDSPGGSDQAPHSHARKKSSRSKSNYAPSIRSTRTTASEKVRREEARERQLEKDWENFYIGEEDSEDEYDRMLMGRSCGASMISNAQKKTKPDETKKVSGGKKAFRWLGLA